MEDEYTGTGATPALVTSGPGAAAHGPVCPADPGAAALEPVTVTVTETVTSGQGAAAHGPVCPADPGAAALEPVTVTQIVITDTDPDTDTDFPPLTVGSALPSKQTRARRQSWARDSTSTRLALARRAGQSVDQPKPKSFLTAASAVLVSDELNPKDLPATQATPSGDDEAREDATPSGDGKARGASALDDEPPSDAGLEPTPPPYQEPKTTKYEYYKHLLGVERDWTEVTRSKGTARFDPLSPSVQTEDEEAPPTPAEREEERAKKL